MQVGLCGRLIKAQKININLTCMNKLLFYVYYLFYLGLTSITNVYLDLIACRGVKLPSNDLSGA
jgi:hypothetical protein